MSRTPQVDATLEQALSLGGTRVATFAQPDCRCQQPKPALPRYDVDYPAAIAAWRAEHGSPRATHYAKKDCPMHKGTAGGA